MKVCEYLLLYNIKIMDGLLCQNCNIIKQFKCYPAAMYDFTRNGADAECRIQQTRARVILDEMRNAALES